MRNQCQTSILPRGPDRSRTGASSSRMKARMASPWARKPGTLALELPGTRPLSEPSASISSVPVRSREKKMHGILSAKKTIHRRSSQMPSRPQGLLLLSLIRMKSRCYMLWTTQYSLKQSQCYQGKITRSLRIQHHRPQSLSQRISASHQQTFSSIGHHRHPPTAKKK